MRAALRSGCVDRCAAIGGGELERVGGQISGQHEIYLPSSDASWKRPRRPEENLVAQAARPRLKGTTVFVTHLCCNACARMLINAGVSRVVCRDGRTSMPPEQFEVAVTMFKEAGVELVIVQDITL